MAQRIGLNVVLGKHFARVNEKNCFGFLRNDIANRIELDWILHKGREIMPRSGWKEEEMFVKRLGSDEIMQMPNERFQNAALLWKFDSYPASALGTVIPYGIIYEGNAADFAVGNVARGYFLSEFVEGKRLLDEWGELDKSQKDEIMALLGIPLQKLAGKNAYAMDFAPRDVVVKRDSDIARPIIVDTEHVVYSGEDSAKEQIKQFRDDYGSFFENTDELNEAERLMFT